MTRYEWTTREIMKWDAIRRAHGENSKAGKMALKIREDIAYYQAALNIEEAEEIMPKEEANGKEND